MKKKPMRTCAVCRQKKNKSDLIRIVNHADEGIVLDASGKMNGRGTYVCTEPDCIQSAQARKKLASALKTEITPENFERLQKKTEEHISYLKRYGTMQQERNN